MATTKSKYIAGAYTLYETHAKRLLNAEGLSVVKYFEDFVQSPLAAADAPLGWTVTLVEAGAGESTITKPDGSGGTLLLTTDANEDDGINMQLTGESFGFSSSQYATYFGIRLQISDATQSDFLVGLCITDTTLLGGMTDGVYFEKLDGSTSLSCVTEKDSTETQTDSVGTVVADTYMILEFYFNGTSVEFFVDGTSVASHTTNIVNDELVTPSIHFLAGAAAVKTMTIDWVRAIQIGR